MLEPYYQSRYSTLYHGDCLAVLPGLAAGSVDLVLADLPYGTTACAWDSVIPLDALWKEYKRVLKPRGAVILTAAQPFTSVLVTSNLEWFKYCLVWEKGRGIDFHSAKFRPLCEHEDIVVFSPAGASYGATALMTYNPIMGERDTPRHKRELGKGNTKNPKSRTYAKYGVFDITYTHRYPVSVLYVANDNQKEKKHPTQKPVALGAYLIRTYSNPGDVVLDNTMGVGSFLVGAVEEGRRVIGIERAPDPTTADDYCGIARDRILAAEAARGLSVPLDAARRPLQLGLAWEGTAG